MQVGFDLHNTPAPQVSLGDLVVTALAPASRDAKLDLFLVLEEGEDGSLRGGLEYRTALFEAATIARFAGHFAQVVDAMVADPEQTLGRLTLLTPGEREELLVRRNATAAAYPHTSNLAALIAQQAQRTPNAPAVIGEDATLSYAQLEARANQLAHFLRQRGVGPNVPVAVCMDRSVALLVGLLGILKAGGAFVPLDPGFPEERLRFMLADSGARTLLCNTAAATRLADACAVVDLRETQAFATQPCAAPPGAAGAQNLCYIIYTSGSTGRPKGVLVSQQAFVNYLVWSLEAYTVAEGRGAPVQSTLAADAIYPSVFAPLLVGRSVVMVPDSAALEALAQVLREQGGFSLMKITPSQLEVLNQQIDGNDPRGWVRTLVIGAEALRGDVVAFWQQNAPQTQLINEYGPTETVVGCSIYRLPSGQPIRGAVPIGLPIANLEFYVLDGEMQPVPIGVPGELYIGGDGLAWGYLNRPDLTAVAFVPHPFSARPGARLYKTGDVVRYLAQREANIEFLGRRDHQVKVSGYRVELGEIEALLATHPGVREVAVVAQGADTQLVAYVVARDTQAVQSDWRAYLQARLPAYMVPMGIVFLDTFPLLTNGKLDRSALPAPTREPPAAIANDALLTPTAGGSRVGAGSGHCKRCAAHADRAHAHGDLGQRAANRPRRSARQLLRTGRRLDSERARRDASPKPGAGPATRRHIRAPDHRRTRAGRIPPGIEHSVRARC